MEREFDLSGLKILIASPSYSGKIEAGFVQGLVEAKSMLANYGVQADIMFQTGVSLVQVARNKIASAFYAGDWNKLVWLDDDISFTGHDLIRLLAYSTTHDVVGAAYPVKILPIKVKVFPVKEDGKLVQNEVGLLEVEGMPLGFSVTDRRAFDLIKDDCPEYEFYDNVNRAWYWVQLQDRAVVGEDIDFCMKYRARGGKIWCDPAIELSHVGPYAYKCNFYD